MVFAKALCAVLLVYSASFGEIRSLQSDSNSEKRAQALGKSPEQIAYEIEKMARKTIYAGGSQQFGYVYLHPSKSNDVKFIHPSVKQILGQFNIKHGILLWPDDGKTTNFRLATPDYSKGQETNYGHSEYQLLTDNKLGQMVTDFKKYYDCPEYVILYSSNLPCVSPENPDNNKPRCAQMVVNAKEEVETICEDAWFYLYTTHETPSSLSDPKLLPQFKEHIRQKIAFLKRNGINWIHP